MIAQALFTPAQQKLLGLLFVRVNDGYHLNEIMRLTGLGSASAQRELKRLHDSGLIVSERIGNVRRFRPNKDCLVYAELCGLVKKTFGLVSVLNSALAPLSSALTVAFVYGATAKEHEAMETNIELLLIGDNTSYGELLSRLPVAERILRRKISPNLYSVPDFKRRLREQQPFILQVLREQKYSCWVMKPIWKQLKKPKFKNQNGDVAMENNSETSRYRTFKEFYPFI